MIRQLPHGFQLVFEYGLIFCHKRHSKQISGSADQAVGRILRKRLREHGRHHGNLGRNLVDDNPQYFRRPIERQFRSCLARASAHARTAWPITKG